MWDYLVTFYLASALLAAASLLPYLEDFCQGVRDTPSKTPSMDQVALVVLLLIFILVPVLNTLLVLHCVDCYFRYPKTK